MRGYLRTLAGQGRAVLVSSHLTSELEDTADHLVVAGRGRVIAGTSARQLLAAASGSRIRLRTTAPARATTALTGAGSAAAPEPGVLNDLQPLFRTDRGSPDPAHDPVHRGDRPPAGAGTGLPGAHQGIGRVPRGRGGLAHLVHAERTRFRTVRGWVTGMIAASLTQGSAYAAMMVTGGYGALMQHHLAAAGRAVHDRAWAVARLAA